MNRTTRALSGGLVAAVAVALAVAGSCAAKKGTQPSTRLAILYQSNNNGEIDPCG